jgi:hypothetical protein
VIISRLSVGSEHDVWVVGRRVVALHKMHVLLGGCSVFAGSDREPIMIISVASFAQDLSDRSFLYSCFASQHSVLQLEQR